MRTSSLLIIFSLVFFSCFCSEESPNQPEDKALNILKFIVFPDSVLTNEMCNIICVSDAQEGDSITYNWSAPEGTITGVGEHIEWQAPVTGGVYSVNCQIIDQAGNSDSSSVRINVIQLPKLVCYTLDQQVYIIDGDPDKPEIIANGGYPFWVDSKSMIGSNSPSNFEFYIINPETGEIVKTYDITGYGTFTFGRYSEVLDIFVFAVNHHGLPAIAIMDISGKIEIVKRDYPLYNPACNGVDDWIYYLNQQDGTFDIFRMKPDGSLDEPIAVSSDFRYGNFSVSYDGKYVSAPKLKDNFHLIAIIDTDTKQERLIDLSHLNLVGYPSFSKDNRYIFFTGDEQRNLYMINFDGTGLKKLTSSSLRCYRPLAW